MIWKYVFIDIADFWGVFSNHAWDIDIDHLKIMAENGFFTEKKENEELEKRWKRAKPFRANISWSSLFESW